MRRPAPAPSYFKKLLTQIAFRPRLLELRDGYTRERFFQDLSAGLTVGVVALPLAMAFAIASGVKPEAGIFTAIIAGFLISALGGSPVQIGGPAGAFIVIVYGIIERYGLANLLISTIMAGMLMVAMGVFRVGNLIRFIPIAIVIGFTNGIAVLIAVSQIKDFFGLKLTKLPGDFFSQLHVMAGAAHTVSWPTLALAAGSLAFIFMWPLAAQKMLRKGLLQGRARAVVALPGTILALVIATTLVSMMHWPVETIGSRFGGIPQSLPAFVLPDFNWELVKQLFAPILTIALLSSIESLLCARVADGLMDDQHDPNQELMAQGIANMVAPFFGGIPATGTIARTVTNIRSGATSPIAGMIHALVLLGIVLVAAPLASNIPLATLSAILIFVAWNMGEWHEFMRLRRYSNNYRVILVGTFLLTVVFDLTVAVEVGLVLACLFFITRMATLTELTKLNNPDDYGIPEHQVEAYHLYGSLFFGAVQKIEGIFDVRDTKRVLPQVIILEIHQLINIDTSGMDALDNLRRALVKRDVALVICEPNAQPASLMLRSGFLRALGRRNVCNTLEDAFERAKTIVQQRAQLANDVAL